MTAIIDTAHSTTTVNSSDTTVIITKPTGTSVGDLLLFGGEFVCNSTIAPTNNPPVGWTLVDETAWDSDGVSYMYAYYRIVDGSEGSSFTFDVIKTGNTFAGGFGNLHRITGVAVSSPIDSNANNKVISGSTGTFPSVTTTVTSELIVQFGYQGGGGTPTTSEWNKKASTSTTLLGAINNGTFGYFGTQYFTQVSSGSTGTKTIPTLALSISTIWNAITIAIKSFIVPPSGGSSLTLMMMGI